MAGLTNKLQGKQEPVPAKESRGTAARLTDDARGWKNESPEGFASPKPRGDKIGKELVANVGKNPTLCATLAMADKLQGNQEPLHAEETRTSKAHRTDYAREVENGKNRGLASPKPRPNEIANKVTSNERMDDRVKKGKQLNAEGRGAVRARVEKKRGLGPPPPKRGAVTKGIVVDMKEVVEAGVKKLTDTGRAFCCAPEPVDVDAFVRDLPFPTRSETTATLWAKVEL